MEDALGGPQVVGLDLEFDEEPCNLDYADQDVRSFESAERALDRLETAVA